MAAWFRLQPRYRETVPKVTALPRPVLRRRHTHLHPPIDAASISARSPDVGDGADSGLPCRDAQAAPRAGCRRGGGLRRRGDPRRPARARGGGGGSRARGVLADAHGGRARHARARGARDGRAAARARAARRSRRRATGGRARAVPRERLGLGDRARARADRGGHDGADLARARRGVPRRRRAGARSGRSARARAAAAPVGAGAAALALVVGAAWLFPAVGLGLRTLIHRPSLFDGAAVSDGPLVGDVRVTYQYPAYTGLPPRTVDGSTGDLVAVKGTRVRLDARPLRSARKALLLLGDGGERGELPAKLADGALSAELTLSESGTYRFWL